jgi:twitching motility two-component system response regulator PilG
MARILIIDDEPEIITLTRMMLQKAGYEVIGAESGKEGLEILEKDKVDLVLLDVVIPDMNGWEVCRRIKADEKLRQIPVVMFTVYDNKEDVMRSHECGADAHLSKPFDREELLDVIRRFLIRSF